MSTYPEPEPAISAEAVSEEAVSYVEDRTGVGVVAAGDRATAEAALRVLADGGTAYDAALAALLAACVAEPVLASLGGGGFLLARPAMGRPVLYDFFAQTPRAKAPANRLDIESIDADFGGVTQPFQIGLGTAAVPGLVPGLFAVHEDLCRVPLPELAAPAITLARRGAVVSPMQAFVARIVAPILTAEPDVAAFFAGAAGREEQTKHRPMTAGDLFRAPELADALELLVEDGLAAWTSGPFAQAIEDLSAERGGHLDRADLAAYRVARRRPLAGRFRSWSVLTNPAPALGGLLVAFPMALLKTEGLSLGGFGSPDHLRAIARALALTTEARVEAALDRGVDPDAPPALLAPDLLDRYRTAMVAGGPVARRGTTHISVVDRAGNAAALTVSNGEGCGRLVPGLGFMLNNMLGEADVNPAGPEAWVPDRRLASMMAPTVLVGDDDAVVALGSGGSNRIRSALFQAITNLAGFRLRGDEAVAAARLHVEATKDGPHLDIEPGYDGAAERAAAEEAASHRIWPERNLFFGGVHMAGRAPDGRLWGAADPRRGGVALLA